MAQYYPAGLVGRIDVRDSYREIDRHLQRDEYVRAAELADELGLGRLDRRSVASGYLLAT
jgi:putative pyruvate formate lyase activating enzyme